MMITILEAIERTGKSEVTIRRFVRKYKHTPNIKLVRGVYCINDDFLYTIHQPTITIDQEGAKQAKQATSHDQIDYDQATITLISLRDQIKDLHQRLKEQNMIIMKMTDQHDKLLSAPIQSTGKQSVKPTLTEAVMMGIIAVGILSLVVYMFMSLVG
jgi:hypothetical protein